MTQLSRITCFEVAFVVVFTVVVACPPAALAQRAIRDDAGVVSFEAAVIKPSRGDGAKSLGTGVPGQFEATGVTLHDLIATAYGGITGRLGDARIVDEPSWFASQRWDVLGKTSRTEGLGRMFLMVQTLLRDRFGLRLEIRQRELPVYALVPARSDQRPGPKLTTSSIDCAKVLPDVEANGRWPVGVEWCGWRYQGAEPVHVEARGVTLEELAARLEPSPSVGRPVIDRTGRAGTFDLAFDFSPSPGPSQGDAIRVSIFTALQRVGLKLESQKLPLDTIVVDKGEKTPIEN